MFLLLPPPSPPPPSPWSFVFLLCHNSCGKVIAPVWHNSVRLVESHPKKSFRCCSSFSTSTYLLICSPFMLHSSEHQTPVFRHQLVQSLLALHAIQTMDVLLNSTLNNGLQIVECHHLPFVFTTCWMHSIIGSFVHPLECPGIFHSQRMVNGVLPNLVHLVPTHG